MFLQKRLKFEICKEDLEIIVWSLPTKKVTEILRVSDVAVTKIHQNLDKIMFCQGFLF